MEKLVIVGAGCAGFTAAVYGARARLEPLILAGDVPGGQLTLTNDVENYPGFKDGILGVELVQQMQAQAERFGARVQYELVESVEFRAGGPQHLHLTGGQSVEAAAVIVATGAKPRRLGLAAEAQLETKGVTYCAICDGALYRNRAHVVVGGGDSAMEEALFLTRFATKVTIVHRRGEFRASKIMAERVLKHPQIEVRWHSVVDDILDVAAKKVTAVRLRNVDTGELSTVPCGAVFVAIGHLPSTAAFRGHLDMDEEGYIKVTGRTTQTSCPGVFAAGDCVDRFYRQAVTAAGQGCQAAIDATRWLETRG